MSGAYRLVVTDTSPLSTLVLTDSLDALLRPVSPSASPTRFISRHRGWAAREFAISEPRNALNCNKSIHAEYSLAELRK
jgi:hypothetical protein